MASEIGRYCGATALTFNMHVSSCLWTGVLADGLDLDGLVSDFDAVFLGVGLGGDARP